jgi:hypothetical protein
MHTMGEVIRGEGQGCPVGLQWERLSGVRVKAVRCCIR